MKPKKKRTKKYQPGRPKIPAWAYDVWGQLTESDIKRIDDVVNVDLNLIRLGDIRSGTIQRHSVRSQAVLRLLKTIQQLRRKRASGYDGDGRDAVSSGAIKRGLRDR